MVYYCGLISKLMENWSFVFVGVCMHNICAGVIIFSKGVFPHMIMLKCLYFFQFLILKMDPLLCSMNISSLDICGTHWELVYISLSPVVCRRHQLWRNMKASPLNPALTDSLNASQGVHRLSNNSLFFSFIFCFLLCIPFRDAFSYVLARDTRRPLAFCHFWIL